MRKKISLLYKPFLVYTMYVLAFFFVVLLLRPILSGSIHFALFRFDRKISKNVENKYTCYIGFRHTGSITTFSLLFFHSFLDIRFVLLLIMHTLWLTYRLFIATIHNGFFSITTQQHLIDIFQMYTAEVCVFFFFANAVTLQMDLDSIGTTIQNTNKKGKKTKPNCVFLLSLCVCMYFLFFGGLFCSAMKKKTQRKKNLIWKCLHVLFESKSQLLFTKFNHFHGIHKLWNFFF